MLAILVPVLFAFMGFALDLGRLYLVRGELNQAANAMALAAAARLTGTSAAADDATAAAQLLLNNTMNTGVKYNFGSIQIGESTGLLNSTASDPTYYESASAALSDDGSGGAGSAGGATARFARVTLQADAPLLFWSFLSLGQSRATPVMSTALSGISAPLCTVCGSEPIAVAAITLDDTADYGFVPATRYTLGYQCTGAGGSAQPLPNTASRVPYLLLNRYDDTSAVDESQQFYRMGAQGMPGSANPALSCITASAEASEQNVVWASAAPQACSNGRVATGVTQFACGLYSRFDNTVPDACASVTGVDTLSGQYLPDRDLTDVDDYTAYTGDTRRVITVAVVESLSPTAPMVVLAFRQFLLEPAQGATATNPGDGNARVAALYIGSVVPMKQGRFDGGCQLTAGPGKVVLHQ